jgi:hypothetical protein
MKSHLFIPDTQVKAGNPVDHIRALGKYAVNRKPDVIIMIGDWWDMPSLSTYEDKGSKYFHGQSYRADVDAGNVAMDLFMAPILREIKRLRKNKKKQWNPEFHFFMGNHENRILRAVKSDPVLEGTIGLNDLNLEHWQVYDYLEIADIDGILYSHYFVNPDSMMGNPVSGTIENKLKLLGQSFSMGHQQKRQYGTRFTAMGRELHGLVCGTFYMHDEDYLGPQKNRQHWRGVVIKHEVKDGEYDPMFVSLNYLLNNWA